MTMDSCDTEDTMSTTVVSDNREDTPSITLVSENREEATGPLCTECKQLDLTVDKFIIKNDPSPIDFTHETHHYQPKRARENFRLKSGKSLKNFANLCDLEARRGSCALCGLIYRSVKRYGKQHVSDATVCSLSWEVHGRETDKKCDFVNRTRRIRLSWVESTGNRREVYLVLVASRDPSKPNSDAAARWQRETHFLGRRFGDEHDKQALIRSWIDLCVKDHGDVCADNHGTRKAFKELVRETYFGVIDVVDMQLKSLPTKNGIPPYVALSYVWGQNPQNEPTYKTNRENIMTHILHGGLEAAWKKLPPTIQDAISLVSRLGYRYIWIDSLCIVQDSHHSWQLNADAMHLVYGNAHFTICAADGEDSSAGLRAVGPSLQSVRPSTPRTTPCLSELVDQDDHCVQSMTADCGRGVRLMVTRPLEAVVNDSAWSKRAWTFQERILSRRCLVFAEGRVYWQCRSTCISQDIHTDGSRKGSSLDRTNSPLRTVEELQNRPIWFYMSYVSMYTGRSLTKQRDILAAFHGISWLLGRHMNTVLLFGLPASHFDLALLWGPLQRPVHRKPKPISKSGKDPCTVDGLGNCTCQVEQESFGGSEFPTWSWSGWMGAKIEYQTGMVDGCLQNVREWLSRHTWIQWHIRDESGHLQPLWNIMLGETGHSSPNKASLDCHYKWTGYPVTAYREIDIQVIRPHSGKNDRSYDLIPAGRRERSRDRRPYSHPIPSRRRVRIDEHSPARIPDYPGVPSPPPRTRKERTPRPPSSRSSSSDEVHYERVTNKAYADHPVSASAADAYYADKPTSEHEYIGASSDEDSDAERLENIHYVDNHGRSPLSPGVVNEPSSNRSDTTPDKYGRVFPKNIPTKQFKFSSILPDNPFGVITQRSPGRKGQPQKNFMPILQFWTWRTELHVLVRDPNMDSTIKQPDTGLCQCDIVDQDGDWCGSIVLDEKWIGDREAYIFPFIAISEAKFFTAEECPVWTYYIPKEREESEWDLYYVLLLERNKERGLWERVGLGKVFQAAFRDKTWSEIKLG